MFWNYNGIKLEIINRKSCKITKYRNLNNTLLINLWIKEEITREITKYFAWNENKNTTYQIYGMQLKLFRDKFKAIYADIRKEEFQINNLGF